jgi:hypothetical protein
MTIGALQLLKERGVAIPEDISLVGFDDLDLSELLNPPLTVIDRATFALGSSAAEILRARLATPDRRQQHLTLPVELIVRGSTAAPALMARARTSPRAGPAQSPFVRRAPAASSPHVQNSLESS